jgi:hypothetical protein
MVCQDEEGIIMTAEHFQELLYTVLLTTKATKEDICRYLNVTRTSLDKWLREGLPKSRGFLIIDSLEDYLFEHDKPALVKQKLRKYQESLINGKVKLGKQQLQRAYENGISEHTVRSRVYGRKWDVERAITEPLKRKKTS